MKIRGKKYNISQGKMHPLVFSLLLTLTAVGGVLAADNHTAVSPATSILVGHMPVASNVTIDPTNPKAGDTVTVSWEYFDKDGDLEGETLVWWRIGTGEFVLRGRTYQLPDDSAGKELEIVVQPASTQGTPRLGLPVRVDATIGAKVDPSEPPVGTIIFKQRNPVNGLTNFAEGVCSSASRTGVKWRLPTYGELQNAFLTMTSATVIGDLNTEGNMEMCSKHNWPMAGGSCGGKTSFYWATDRAGAGPASLRAAVNMETGRMMFSNTGNSFNVACIRIE